MAVVNAMPRFGLVLARLFQVQAAWSYERMMGVGFGHAAEPALRDLGGPSDGGSYRAAVARQTAYFNAHPYFAGLAVGAAVRAEHDGEPPEKIVRLRDALCGPLGSLGDRLIWAAWLPACAAIGIVMVALGARAWAALVFLALYNAVHVACRVLTLRAGWRRGMQVAGALSGPELRLLGAVSVPLAALALGIAVPVAFGWQMRGVATGQALIAAASALVVAGMVRAVSGKVSGATLAGLVLTGTLVAGIVWS